MWPIAPFGSGGLCWHSEAMRVPLSYNRWLCSVDEQRCEVYRRNGKLTLDLLNSADLELTPLSIAPACAGWSAASAAWILAGCCGLLAGMSPAGRLYEHDSERFGSN